MEIKTVVQSYKNEFDKLASHPLQSWEWGEFRKKSGVEAVRLGKFDGSKLTEAITVTFHPIPYTSYKIAYIPKSYWPSDELLNGIYAEAEKRNCIFVKLEPNIEKNSKFEIPALPAGRRNSKFPILRSGHPLFTRYTFQLDLTQSEENLLKGFHPKTRYNIKIAQKNGVKVTDETNNERAYETHLDLMFDTTKRQGFFAHDREYHENMWSILKKEKMAYLIQANYQHEDKGYLLASWILFLFNDVLYYPYGASSDKFRNVMASNLIMWEAICFGKKSGAKLFDMWGSLGPDADPKDPWFGFHRFKQGYGAKLVEFAGSYDLVIQPSLYKIYNRLHSLRQVFLKIKRPFTS